MHEYMYKRDLLSGSRQAPDIGGGGEKPIGKSFEGVPFTAFDENGKELEVARDEVVAASTRQDFVVRRVSRWRARQGARCC